MAMDAMMPIGTALAALAASSDTVVVSECPFRGVRDARRFEIHLLCT
jgi:hypothetical protein